MSVIEEIAAERRRQIERECWKPEHDDEHTGGELAQAAASYALRAAGRNDQAHDLWPWPDDSWNPKDRRRDLIRSAALIVAEVERIDRRADSAGGGHA